MRIKILMMLVVAFFIVDIKAMDAKRENSFDYLTFNNDWELLKTEDGINVYVSTYEWVDGALKLQVKFENTNSTDVNLSFDVTSNDTDATKREYSVLVKANSSVEFLDEKSPITINVGQTKKDFTINFK